MRVILNQQEIETAIENYILDNVTVPDDHRIDIDLKATRGDEGYTAEIDLLHHAEPAGSRVVDDRIEAKPEAVQEGLGIVDKINEAKATASNPRRRGRPAGSKNKATTDSQLGQSTSGQDNVFGNIGDKLGTTSAAEAAIEEHPASEEAVVEEVQTEAQEETPAATVEEPVADTEVAAAEATALNVSDLDAESKAITQEAETELNVPAQDPVEPVAEPAVTRPSLFGGPKPTPAAEPAEEAPVEEVDEPVEVEAEPNSEKALAAEAAVTEPVEEAPAPVKTRSLFGDLKKPTN